MKINKNILYYYNIYCCIFSLCKETVLKVLFIIILKLTHFINIYLKLKNETHF